MGPVGGLHGFHGMRFCLATVMKAERGHLAEGQE